jgi:hypothetical protein
MPLAWMIKNTPSKSTLRAALLAWSSSLILFSFAGFYFSISVVAILIICTLLFLIKIHLRPQKNLVEANDFVVLKNQDAGAATLIKQINGASKVQLLEYAAATTLPLIRAIREKAAPLQLLIKHPDTLEGMQKQRTLSTIDTLINSVFSDYIGEYEIRCYRLPYTLRARKFCDISVELGWLTPDLANESAHGSRNLSILFYLANDKNQEAKLLFDRTFNDYWNDSRTEDAKSVLSTYKNQPESTKD